MRAVGNALGHRVWPRTTRSTPRSTADPIPLIQTIENTFGIPINHFVIIDFNGVIDLVKAVGGINLNFPYPVRDNDNGNNNSGLDITRAGCQTLNGNMALALARSRYYQYEVRPGYWVRPTAAATWGASSARTSSSRPIIDKAKLELQPAHGQRLPRFDRPRHHQGRRPCRRSMLLSLGPAVPRLLGLAAQDVHAADAGRDSAAAGVGGGRAGAGRRADDRPVPGHAAGSRS